MVNHVEIIDKVQANTYCYMLESLFKNELSADEFASFFCYYRANDNFWMNGIISDKLARILDAFFNDVDDYTPDELFVENEPYSIDKTEFLIRAKKTFESLQQFR